MQGQGFCKKNDCRAGNKVGRFRRRAHQQGECRRWRSNATQKAPAVNRSAL